MINIVDLYFIIIVGLKNLGFNSGSKIYLILFVFGCAIVGSKIVSNKYTKKEILIMCLLVIIGILDFWIGKSPTIMFTAIALCSLKNVDLNRLLKIILVVKIVTFISMIILSFSGIISEPVVTLYRDGKYIKRYLFGYNHPNEAHIAFASIIFIYMYLNMDKCTVLKSIVLFVLNYIMYIFTVSRTGLITVTLCILIWGLWNKFPKMHNKLVFIAKKAYSILFIITIFSALLYSDSNISVEADRYLSGRLNYNSYLLKNYFPPIIGNEIYNKFVNIDNGYIALMYNGGISAFILISYLYIKTCKILDRKNKSNELLLILFFLSYTLTESFLPSISVNISLIFLAYAIFDNTKKEENT